MIVLEGVSIAEGALIYVASGIDGLTSSVESTENVLLDGKEVRIKYPA